MTAEEKIKVKINYKDYYDITKGYLKSTYEDLDRLECWKERLRQKLESEGLDIVKNDISTIISLEASIKSHFYDFMERSADDLHDDLQIIKRDKKAEKKGIK